MTDCALPYRVRSLEDEQHIRELARFLLSGRQALLLRWAGYKKARGGAHPWSMGAYK